MHNPLLSWNTATHLMHCSIILLTGSSRWEGVFNVGPYRQSPSHPYSLHLNPRHTTKYHGPGLAPGKH